MVLLFSSEILLAFDHDRHKYRLGGEWFKSNLKEKDLEVLVHEKLNMTRQCALAVQKAKHILGCIDRNMTNKSRKMILALYSALYKQSIPY